MAEFTTPEVYHMAQTSLDLTGAEKFFVALEIEDWDTDAPSDAEELIEIAGRRCYNSFVSETVAPGALNPNISRVREGNRPYLGNILNVNHGALLEHCYDTYMLHGVSRVFTHELVRHRVGTAFCLAGDTKIYSGSKVNGQWDGVRKKWSIEQLYQWSQDSKRKGRLKLITVRTFDGQKFVPSKIKQIFQSGVKPIFKIILADGKEIRCSKDHLFLTQNGWDKVEYLCLGESIACNGVAVDGRKTEKFSLDISQRMHGSSNHRWLGDNVGPNGGRKRARQILKVTNCEVCGAIENLYVHHRDENPANNNLNNLQGLCASCHNQHHLSGKNNPNSLLKEKWVEIISIEPDGEEMTYDLEIDHPAHNFVANGIVTHNSQESLRYVRLTDINMWFPSCFENLSTYKRNMIKVEFLEVMKEAEARYQRISDIVGIDSLTNFSEKKKYTSAMRRIMPIGLATGICVSANHRTWRHTIELRTSRHAEEEIRFVFGVIAEDLARMYPNLYQDMQADEVDGYYEYTFGHKD